MSTGASGRVIDENSNGLGGLTITLEDISALFSSQLGNAATTQSDGTFSIGPYDDDFNTATFGPRKLQVRIFTKAHRLLSDTEIDDVAAATLPLPDITIRQADASGWVVTLPLLKGSPAALPVRDGNAVRPLIDNEEAWGHLKDSMLAATTSISVMQLSFDMPPQFDAVPQLEDPEIVLSFGSPVDPVTPRRVTNSDDYRPERILLDKAQQGLKVRISMSRMTINWLIATIDFLLLVIPLLVVVILDVGRSWKLLASLLASKPGGGFSDVKGYFGAAGSSADVASFDNKMFRVIHAKLLMVDDTEAIVLGSPFSQSYWDTHAHRVFEPRRGSASGEPVPVHDVSVAVRGPAVKDMHDAFRLHWNLGKAAGQQIAPIPVAAPVTTPEQGESIASLQLVRSINSGVFPEVPNGEQGVLEAYLRAIEMATTYIYFENQYFTNDTIADALADALNDGQRPNLQIIVLLNVTPDIPYYPVWQSRLIERIRKEAKGNASRIGFFTAWTHDPPVPQLNQNKPMIMANYLHTKAAIVDGKWATIGSANLDGASLDAFQLIQAIQFGTNRNHELNYLIFTPDAIDAFRRKLWGEHLGIDPSDARLASNVANDAAWVALWRATAERKRAGLVSNPGTIDPANGRVLEYPVNAKTGLALLLPWVNPERDFLKSCGITFDNLDLIDQTRPFSFHDGEWK